MHEWTLALAMPMGPAPATTSSDGGRTWAPLFDMVLRRRARGSR